MENVIPRNAEKRNSMWQWLLQKLSKRFLFESDEEDTLFGRVGDPPLSDTEVRGKKLPVGREQLPRWRCAS